MAASLLVGVAAGVLWLVSYWRPLAWWRTSYLVEHDQYRHYWVQSADGRLMASFWRVRIDQPFVQQMRERSATRGFGDNWMRDRAWMWRPQSSRWWERFGACAWMEKDVQSGIAAGRGSHVMVIVPYWVLFLFFLIWPGIVGAGWWRRRRWRPGTCRNCGYDLRASAGRCPECGRENGTRISEPAIP